MRSFFLVAATMAALATVSFAARAEDSSAGKSAPTKGPPNANANANEGSGHESGKMKGPPNANGHESTKDSSSAPK